MRRGAHFGAVLRAAAKLSYPTDYESSVFGRLANSLLLLHAVGAARAGDCSFAACLRLARRPLALTESAYWCGWGRGADSFSQRQAMLKQRRRTLCYSLLSVALIITVATRRTLPLLCSPPCCCCCSSNHVLYFLLIQQQLYNRGGWVIPYFILLERGERRGRGPPECGQKQQEPWVYAALYQQVGLEFGGLRAPKNRVKQVECVHVCVCVRPFTSRMREGVDGRLTFSCSCSVRMRFFSLFLSFFFCSELFLFF
jgi:hypothetical protein